MIGTSGESYQF